MRISGVRIIAITCLVCIAVGSVSACSDNSPEALLNKAVEARTSGDLQTATIHLKNLLQSDPENIEGRIQLGEISLELSDAPAAEKEFRRALELGASMDRVRDPLGRAMLQQGHYQDVLDYLDPAAVPEANERKKALVIAGIAYAELGKYNQAVVAYESALAIDPNYIDAVTELAGLMMGMGRHDEADKYIERALSIDTEHVQTLLLRGSLKQRAGQYAEAESVFKEVLSLEADNDRKGVYALALAQVIEVQLTQNKVDDALESTTALLAFDDRIYPRFLRARVAAQMDQLVEASQYLLDILRDAPHFQPAEKLLGAIYVSMGNLPQAEMYLQRALIGDPNDDFTRRLLAELSLRQNNPEKAMLVLRPALANGERPTAGLLALAGQASLQTGNEEQALEYFRNSVSTDPDDLQLRLGAASTLMLAGELDLATTLLENIPESGLESGAAETIKIFALVWNENTDQAIPMARQLVEDYPRATWPMNLLGAIYQTAGDSNAARSMFEQALALDPADIPTLQNLARLDVASADTDAAKRRLQQVLDGDPDNFQALMSLAHLELGPGGNTEAAKSLLIRARQIYVGSVEASLLLAKIYLEQDNADAARPLLESAIATAPINPDARNLYGLTLLKLGDTGKAADSFENAVRLDPKQAHFYLNLAQTQIIVHDNTGALDSLFAANSADSQQLPPIELLSNISLSREEQGAAQRLYAQIRSVAPNAIETRFLEGMLRYSQGRFGAAAVAYDSVYSLSPSRVAAIRSFEASTAAGQADATGTLESWVRDYPTDVDGLFAVAAAMEQQGDRAGAIEQYEKLLLSNPNHAVSLNNLAMLYYRQDDSRALQTAERAYSSAGDHPAILDTLGWLQVEDGDLERGISLLESAAARSPDAEIQYHLAVAYARSGNTTKARSLLESLLRPNTRFDNRAEAAALLKSLPPP